MGHFKRDTGEFLFFLFLVFVPPCNRAGTTYSRFLQSVRLFTISPRVLNSVVTLRFYTKRDMWRPITMNSVFQSLVLLLRSVFRSTQLRENIFALLQEIVYQWGTLSRKWPSHEIRRSPKAIGWTIGVAPANYFWRFIIIKPPGL